MKKIVVLLLIAVCSACSSKQNKACGIQMCDYKYVTVGVVFKNSKDSAVTIKNITAINLRTNKPLAVEQNPGNIDFVYNYVLLASDAHIKDFSTAGDDVKISATNAATLQTKTAVIKIAGGCSCHVSKISGPDTIIFD